MKRKPHKKADKTQAEKLALRSRMLDLLFGAHGGYQIPDGFPQRADDADLVDDHGTIVSEFGSETFGAWLHAMSKHLTFASETQAAFLLGHRQLAKFDVLEDAVTHLYEAGVRA